MKHWIRIILLIFIASNALPAQENKSPESLMKQMSAKAKEVKTIRYEAVMSERIEGKMVEKRSYFKINTSPHQLYVSQSFLGIKIEGLYAQGWNKNQMLVTTIGFPWIQANLDPQGKRVRDNHHHTINEAGFAYFVGVIDEILSKHTSDVIIKNIGTEVKNGKVCNKIQLEVKSFKISKYTIQAGENLTTIAKKFLINDYMLLEMNKGIDYYDDVKAGQVINMPNAYGQRMVLYLDPELLLPVQIDIYDDKGLYGSYFYKNLVINQPFTWNEFNPTNPNYHFD